MDSAQPFARPSCLFVFLCVLGASGGCTNYSDDTPPPTLPAEWTEFVTALTQAHCASIPPCCAQAGLDASKCEPSLRSVLDARLERLSGRLGIAFDPAAAARLVEFVRTANSACSNRKLAESGAIAWGEVFRGTIPEGATCQISEECQRSAKGTAECVLSSYPSGVTSGGAAMQVTSSVCGYTQAVVIPPHAAMGQPCTGSCTWKASVCTPLPADVAQSVNCYASDGLYCEAGICAAVAKLGEPCSTGMFCESGGHCEEGVCVADRANGACSSDDQCALSSYCDQVAQQCMPLKTKDAACVFAFECESGACEQGRCSTWSVATASTCGGAAYTDEVP
jgi:hypothetical protein